MQDHPAAVLVMQQPFQGRAGFLCQGDHNIAVIGFLRFADYFFDGLFADWAVADRISESMSAVQKTRNQIGHLVDKLTKMKEDAERREKRLRDRADAIVVEA